MRTIPSKILSLEDLKAPKIFGEIADQPRGIVLVTGPTGSGKSTTLAAMVNHNNENEYGHILTVEDPIEFVHESKKCLINQREVGPHTLSFSNALRTALREDPDVILVGEMRDLETIRLALIAARKPATWCSARCTRVPPPRPSTASSTCSRRRKRKWCARCCRKSLRAVISQTLLKTKDGTGRVAAHEIMIGTPAIRNLIRENKIAQMYSAIQTGQQFGMQTLDQNLQELVQAQHRLDRPKRAARPPTRTTSRVDRGINDSERRIWNANRQSNSCTTCCARCSARRHPTCSSPRAFRRRSRSTAR